MVPVSEESRTEFFFWKFYLHILAAFYLVLFRRKSSLSVMQQRAMVREKLKYLRETE